MRALWKLPKSKVRLATLLLSSLSLSLLVAACAYAPQTPPPGGGTATCPDTITIQNFAFNPQSCTVSVGTTLTFVNNDSTSHTATADAGAPVAFDTGALAPGSSAKVTFTQAGTYPYHCEIHPDMHGTITVVKP